MCLTLPSDSDLVLWIMPFSSSLDRVMDTVAFVTPMASAISLAVHPGRTDMKSRYRTELYGSLSASPNIDEFLISSTDRLR